MKFLLFRLYAPLSSWGEIAAGGERCSSDHPSRSAIIGLISAAMGIRRDDKRRLSQLDEYLGVGIKMLSSGDVLHDYHTIEVPVSSKNTVYHTRKSELSDKKSLKTILSNREYRSDALSIIAIWGKADSRLSLDEIKESLLTPKFHLYLGRKSCPLALPMSPIILEEDSLLKAFSMVDFNEIFMAKHKQKDDDDQRFLRLDSSKISYYWEETTIAGMHPDFKIKRFDAVLDRSKWLFTTRDEFKALGRKEQ